MISTVIGLRYSRSRSSNRFLSLVSIVSFCGLTLGVVALVVVVSVMNGFDRELKQRILGVIPHAVVTGMPADDLKAELSDLPVVGMSSFLEDKGLLVSDQASRLVSIYGVEPAQEHEMSILPDHIIQGELLKLNGEGLQVFLGLPIARRLGVGVNDSVTLIMPRVSPAGGMVKPKLSKVTVVGTFQVGSELDYGLAVMAISDLSSISQGEIGQRVRMDNVFDAPRIGKILGDVQGVQVSDWTEVHGDFFATVRMEKIMMFVLLSFVIAVAAFSIVSSLSMMVNSKKRDIAVLRTMGLSERGVMGVFLVQGMLVAGLGVLVGVVMGIPLTFAVPDIMVVVESLIGLSIVEGTYFTKIPVDVRYPDVIAIVIVSLVISLLATVYPSFRASRLNPSEVLRYE